MVLHKVSASRGRTSDLLLYSSDKLFHHVSYSVIHSTNSQLQLNYWFGDWDAEENRMDKGKEKLEKYWVRDFFEKFQTCWYLVTFHLDLELQHSLDVNSSGDHRVQVWLRSGHLSGREAICARSLQRQMDRWTTDAAPLHYLIGMS